MGRVNQLGRRPRSPHSARWSGRPGWTGAWRRGGRPTRRRVGETYAPRGGRRAHRDDGLESGFGGRVPRRPRQWSAEGQTQLDRRPQKDQGVGPWGVGAGGAGGPAKPLPPEGGGRGGNRDFLADCIE